MNSLKLKRVILTIGGLSLSAIAYAYCVAYNYEHVERVGGNVVRDVNKNTNDKADAIIKRITDTEKTIKEALIGDKWATYINSSSSQILSGIQSYVSQTQYPTSKPVTDKNGRVVDFQPTTAKMPLGSPTEGSVGLYVLKNIDKVGSVPEALAHVAAMEQGQKLSDQALAALALSIDTDVLNEARINMKLNYGEVVYENVARIATNLINPDKEKSIYDEQLDKIALYASPTGKLTGMDGSEAANQQLSTTLTIPAVLPLGSQIDAADYVEKNGKAIFKSDKHMSLLTDMLVGVESLTVGNHRRMTDEPELTVLRLKTFARKQLARMSVFQSMDPKTQDVLNEEYVRYVFNPGDQDFADAINKSSQYWLAVIAKQNQGLIASTFEMRRLQLETNRLLGVLLATAVDTNMATAMPIATTNAIANSTDVQ